MKNHQGLLLGFGKKYLALDKQELLLAAKKAGVNFQFDEDGDISNYT